MRINIAIGVLIAAMLGCTIPTAPKGADVNQTITINFTDPTTTETPAPTGQAGSVILSPDSITLSVGQTVSILVTARENGQEIPSANITVNVLPDDRGETIARFAGQTDRTIQIEGLAAGETEAIVTASGFQASLEVRVE